MTAPVNDSTVAWENFIDVANDVKRWLQIPSTDTTRDNDLQDLTDAACWWIQDQLGQPVAPTRFFRRFNGYSGWGGSIIELPYYPVLADPPWSITVVEYWGASGPHTLTQQTPESQGNSDMFTLDPLKGHIIRSYLGLLARPTFPGLKNIEVTWTAGRNPIPPPLKLAAREYVKYWWDNTQQASRGVRLRDGYGDAGSDQYYDDWPGVEAKIKVLLRPYMQVGLS
jgi:hypothetical protein